jgi:MSHA biogenesis protein MshI
VAKRAEPFRGADVALAAIDIPEMAQRNLCCLFEPENRAVALLAFYPEGALLTITGRGELLVARRIEVPLERLLGKDVAQTSQFLDRIALELQRSTDNFDRQFSFIALSKLLLANVPETTGLKETLKANLDVAVEDMNLAQVLDVGRVPELMNGDRQSQCLGVLGAALRTSAASPAVAVAA